MSNPSESDSSEDAYYTYNVSTSLLDLTSYEEEVSATNAKRLLPTSAVKGLLVAVVKTVSTSVGLTWDSLCFLAAYVVFSKQKALSLVHLLDISKDRLVHFLMWRRGLLFRPATHGGVIALSALAVVSAGIFSKAQIAAQDLATNNAIVAAPNTPETIIPVGRPRSEVVTYTVKSGDSVGEIAEKFAISADSVKWANKMISDTIKPGQNLQIPPVSGVVYKVNSGDTLVSIAKKFSADTQTIADYPFNYLDSSLALRAGQTLVVPNGSIPKPVAPLVPTRAAPAYIPSGSGVLGWPVPGGGVSQYATWWHPAIDISAPYGTAVYSAAAGRVIVSKAQAWGFGWYIVIDHGSGTTSTYAHMSALYGRVGDNVSRGQLIGAVGTSGFATGPHLHFQVTQGGSTVNPLSLLP